MRELLSRLVARPWLAFEIGLASLLASALGLASPIFVMLVLNRYVAHAVDATLATLAAGAAIAAAMEFGFRQVRLRMAEALGRGRDRALGEEAFDGLTRSRMAALEALPAGLRREVIAGLGVVQSAYAAPNMCALLDVPAAVVFLVALGILDLSLGAVAAGCLVVLLALASGVQASLAPPSRDLVNASAHRSDLVGGGIVAAETVRAFGAQDRMRRFWREQGRAFERALGRLHRRQGLLQGMVQGVQALMGIVIIAVGAMLVVRGRLDIGSLIGANILALRAVGPLVRLPHLAAEFAKARQALAMLKDFARLPREREGGAVPGEFRGGLELRDVGFAFPGVATPLFESLSLVLPPGGVLAVIGDNGSGKTTLARLLLGLIEPSRGQILADGVDVQQLAPSWWRAQVVYLPQEPRFVGATVRDALAENKPTMGEATMHRLLATAGLKTFVDASPGGLDAPLLRGGDNLSLGIRRRLALARALAGDGMLVVMDEPTEGLDATGAARVYAAMNDLARRGRTIVAFSHDPAIVKGAHVVLDLNVKPVPAVRRTRTGGGAEDSTADPATGDSRTVP